MVSAISRRRSVSFGRAALVLIASGGALPLLAGCQGGSKGIDPTRTTTDSGVVLGADAEDPTARDRRRGIGRWREADETPGTLDPMHPDRRTHGWGADDGE